MSALDDVKRTAGQAAVSAGARAEQAGPARGNGSAKSARPTRPAALVGRRRSTPAGLLAQLVLIVGAAFTLLPVYMGVLNSVKTEGEMLNGILSWPRHFAWSNYADAYRKIDFLRSLGNTAAVTAVGLAGIVLFAAMAGYKLSRTPGKLSGFLFGLFVLSMLIPFHSIMITLVRIAKNLTVRARPSVSGSSISASACRWRSFCTTGS